MLALGWQHVGEVPAPADRVLAGAIALDLGCVPDQRAAAANPRRRLGRACQNDLPSTGRSNTRVAAAVSIADIRNCPING
jgi:hypothetical protein